MAASAYITAQEVAAVLEISLSTLYPYVSRGLSRSESIIDYGLVTLVLPPSGALALFAIGRTMGWIGQAIEAYQEDRLIRPRARYVGVAPEPL